MYTNEIVKERVKTKATEQGRSVRNVLMSCGINTCFIQQLNGNKGITATYLCKLADELDCTTDYLLGRSDR